MSCLCTWNDTEKRLEFELPTDVWQGRINIDFVGSRAKEVVIGHGSDVVMTIPSCDPSIPPIWDSGLPSESGSYWVKPFWDQRSCHGIKGTPDNPFDAAHRQYCNWDPIHKREESYWHLPIDGMPGEETNIIVSIEDEGGGDKRHREIAGAAAVEASGAEQHEACDVNAEPDQAERLEEGLKIHAEFGIKHLALLVVNCLSAWRLVRFNI